MRLDFELEEIVETASGHVEVRARLSDGRLAIVDAPIGDHDSYRAVVRAYLDEHFPDKEKHA